MSLGNCVEQQVLGKNLSGLIISDDDDARALSAGSINPVFAIRHHRVGPAENPLGGLVGHVHAAVAMPPDEIVVPVGAVDGDG